MFTRLVFVSYKKLLCYNLRHDSSWYYNIAYNSSERCAADHGKCFFECYYTVQLLHTVLELVLGRPGAVYSRTTACHQQGPLYRGSMDIITGVSEIGEK